MFYVDLVNAPIERQFEPTEGGFIYRRNSRGQGYIASQAETATYLGECRKATRNMTLSLLVTIPVGIVSTFLILLGFDSSFAPMLSAAATVLSILLPFLYFIRVQNRARTRLEAAIQGMGPVAPALSREHARRRLFKRRGYAEILFVPAVVILSSILQLKGTEAFTGARSLAWILLGIGIALIVVQIGLKLRASQD